MRWAATMRRPRSWIAPSQPPVTLTFNSPLSEHPPQSFPPSSAGHTGATVLATHLAFGMIPGVDRPALATAIPTRARAAVLLDAGANVECRPHHLLQFALMGVVFARIGFGIERPRVGLLSIGEEATKGNDLTREAHRLLKAAPLNFIGNIEGREIYSGVADVIVCDG